MAMNIDGQDSFSVNDLEIGATCPCDFLDDHGVLLIADGVEITHALVNKLRTRGVTSLHVKRSGSAAGRKSSTSARGARKTRKRTPNLEALSSSYDAAKIQRIRKQFAASERVIVQMTDTFRRGRAPDFRATEPHIDNFILELADDPDPIVANALRYESNLELARRCVQFSVLSLAIGQQMEFPIEEMRDIGSAALIHDWGLFDLPPESRFPHQISDDETRAAYLRHPIVAQQMLEHVEGVKPVVKLYVLQVHELLDGTGFPAQLKSDQIQSSSRVLAVADAYLTMTCPPRDAARIVPCDAIAYLISAASQGSYSAAAVKGLLMTVTMYPIGSIVELNDSSMVRVIRSNGSDFGYPIVETLSRPSREINLKQSELYVTRPITSTENNEVRLSETYVELGETLRLNQA